jgi:mannosyl-3-phosphoglycerate phosphatase
VVFTELDGALLDPATFRYDESRAALDRLQKEGVPLVICSGKTRAEIEYLRRDIGNTDPFIVENGGAVYIPTKYFAAPAVGSVARNGYDVLEFGVPYARLRDALRTIEGDLNLKLTGFGDMTIDEIVRLTGLAQPDAERARQRAYDEPFVIAQGAEVTPDVLARIREAASQMGLTILVGERFLHLAGGTDKGRACRVLIEQFRREHGSAFQAVAFGSAPSDVPMLAAVDRPFLVARPEGLTSRPLSRLDHLARLSGIGPAGFAEGIALLFEEAPDAASA